MPSSNYKSLFLLPIFLLLLSCESEVEVNDTQSQEALSLPERPNILWLVAEDLSPFIPSFGDSTIQTPNISRLAAEGVCYDNFYSPSPVCAPSRAAISTGMYPTRIGANHMRTGPWYAGNISDEEAAERTKFMPEGISFYEALPPPGVKMMSEVLRGAGYYCTNNAKMDYQFRPTVMAWDESGRQAHWRNRDANQPFFAVFNFEVTHESRIWRKAEDSLWVDPNLSVPIPPYLPDTEVGVKDVRRMYSNIREMDYQVGEILQQLEEDGLLESTIIFWYTDHGGPLPRHKRLLYDSGLKVPLVIRFPEKQLAQTRNDDLLSFIDLAPTTFSLAGITPEVELDGKAFLGPQATREKRRYIRAAADRFDAQYDTNRAIRDKRYKYIRYYQPEKSMFLPVAYREQMAIMRELHRLEESGEITDIQAQWFRPQKPKEELFDTQSDPHEIKDLAQDPAYKDILAELSAECDRWVNSFEDTGMMPEKDLIEKLWPGHKAPHVKSPIAKKDDDKLSLSCATEGASLAFRIVQEGEKLGTWQVYTDPIVLKDNEQIEYVADRIGYRPSAIERYVP
ncbi:MAG: sulfatase [Saprospiraceae bacterium]|nr:sulfatase [Saprospiraceae bacterium]